MNKSAFDASALRVSPAHRIIDVLRVIDAGSLEIAFVCDEEGVLLATVSDGDIRRALLGGRSLESPIAEVGNAGFTSVRGDVGRAEALRIMVERHFGCLPVVDADGRLVGVHALYSDLRGYESDSWAVVMAGGKGERLGELTHAMPKPMLPVGDRPILEHIVELLASHGIRRIFLSVNYLGKMIESHFGDGRRFRCRIEYLWEETPLGTGGPLALLPERPTAPLVVMNGDLMTNINLTRMIEAHSAGRFAATVALRQHLIRVPFGVAEVEGQRLTRLVEKPSFEHLINAGIYVLDPDLLDRIPRGRPFPITQLIDDCLARGTGVGAYHLQEHWNDIGMPDEFQAAQAAARGASAATARGG